MAEFLKCSSCGMYHRVCPDCKGKVEKGKVRCAKCQRRTYEAWRKKNEVFERTYRKLYAQLRRGTINAENFNALVNEARTEHGKQTHTYTSRS